MGLRQLRDIVTDLPVLVAFVRTGSVTAAADELGIPQPSASRALSRLSSRLDMKLTVARGRGRVPTDAGEALAAAASEALTLIDDGISAAAQAAQAYRTTVGVAYQTALGERYMPKAIARFTRRFPGVRFELTSGSRAHCMESVTTGVSDIALVADAEAPEGLSATSLFSEPLFAVVGTQHPFTRLERPVRPDELARESLIVLGPEFGLYDSVQNILSREAPVLKEAMQVGDSRLARGLAASGVGITIMPPSTSHADDDVAEILIDHPEARRSISALMRHDAGPMAQDFVRTLASIPQHHLPYTG